MKRYGDFEQVNGAVVNELKDKLENVKSIIDKMITKYTDGRHYCEWCHHAGYEDFEHHHECLVKELKEVLESQKTNTEMEVNDVKSKNNLKW